MQASLIKFLAVFWLFLAFSAHAIEVEVKVFEKGVNAMEARTKALGNAERRGFDALVKQKAPEQAEQILKDYKGYNISPYILGYHAKNEVVTDTSYRAIIILDFDDRFVNNVLQQSITPQASQNTAPPPVNEWEETGQAILVFPVFRSPKGVMLWEEENLWRRHINKMVLERGRGMFVVPYGDPSDKLSVNASNITTANFARLAPLVQRYGANRALIAIIHERGLNGFGLTLREISPQGDALDVSHVKPEEGISPNQLLEMAADDLISNYLKRQHALLHPEAAPIEEEEHEITAYIALNNARDWGELRARLQAINAIDEMQVQGADASGMTLSIKFHGKPKQFGEALIKHGISATQKNQQLWLALR